MVSQNDSHDMGGEISGNIIGNEQPNQVLHVCNHVYVSHTSCQNSEELISEEKCSSSK